jgi:hypothetical protein
MGIFIIFLIYHGLVWSLITSKIFDAFPYYVGDLGRMSYQINSLFPRIEHYTLPKKHWDIIHDQSDPIDVITIGDSFSNGMGKLPSFVKTNFSLILFPISTSNLMPLFELF